MTRIHHTGEFWSVQVYDLARAPGSGWYEVARFDNEGHARVLCNLVFRGITSYEAEAIGDMLATAREFAHAQGVIAGIASEKKRCVEILDEIARGEDAIGTIAEFTRARFRDAARRVRGGGR
jgi:hypothetical protein